MFKILFTIPILLFFSFLGLNDTTKPEEITVCHTYGRDDMRQFALDPEFQSLHLAPVPFHFEAMGQNIDWPVAEGANGKGYMIKSAKKSKKWLFVFQEWWGLNDHIKAEADKYYKDLGGNVNVLAIDMYDGKAATTAPEAGKLMSEVKEPRLAAIVKGAYAMAGKKAKVGNVGWCFGGAWSLKSALLGGKNNVGSVIYYGMPVRDVEQLKTLNGDVLGLFATETRISKEVIEEFAAKMKEAGKKLDYTIYDAVHGFSNPSNPKHNPELTTLAYAKALTFLKSKY